LRRNRRDLRRRHRAPGFSRRRGDEDHRLRAPQTVPDPVVRTAGEVELVGAAPEVLRQRMARGHIYPPPDAEAALGGWYQTGNL